VLARTRANSVRVDQYRNVPITQQLVQIQISLEYLTSVKGALISLRDGIQTILSDDEAVHG
jgi:hypothetical protein